MRGPVWAKWCSQNGITQDKRIYNSLSNLQGVITRGHQTKKQKNKLWDRWGKWGVFKYNGLKGGGKKYKTTPSHVTRRGKKCQATTRKGQTNPQGKRALG